MLKLNILSIISSAALSLALVSNASATTITTGGSSAFVNEGQMTSVAGATTTTFDGLTALPAGFTAVGTTPVNPLVSGNVLNVYKTPSGDTSTYLTTGTGKIIDSLAKDTDYFGFYWGSLDTYNTFSILDSAGNTFSITGAQMATQYSLAADGNTSYFVNVYATPGTSFVTAAFSSTNYAMEVDNVASATPEPGTVALLAGGLLIVAGSLRRRKA